jgi:hypothetical protein|tara:strand:+ start:451 stop:933 length:483 start_codon:yes stop_codon:yes gene_type:complete
MKNNHRKEQTEKFALSGLAFCGVLLIVLVLFSFLTSCTVEDDDLLTPQPTLELDGRLPIDSNGFYHLELNDSSNQTIHTISGTVGNTLYWDEPIKVEWNSNLYWEYEGEDVSTSNQASYVVDGKVHNVIAPINTMVGDTLILTGIIREHLVSKTIKFVLD